jgi:hypothetical protein
MGRERAVEQLPELMGRIYRAQEEIGERESEYQPTIQRYSEKLADIEERIRATGSEDEASQALVDYVEAYTARLEVQAEALQAIQSPVIRMRADARELSEAAKVVGKGAAPPGERQSFAEDQFQGVASGVSELAQRLGREEDAAMTGALLQASWASNRVLDLPLARVGPEGATAFAARVETLYARYQARVNQVRAERRAVRRLLDVLIERQLAERLDQLFVGDQSASLTALLSVDGESQDWNELGHVVSRVLGLPSGRNGSGVSDGSSLGELEYFARGDHRQ